MPLAFLTRNTLIAAVSAAALAAGATPATAAETVRVVHAEMSGWKVPEGMGDDDGRGLVVVELHEEDSQVCWRMLVTGVTLPATGAHIHYGRRGQIGDHAVDLVAPDRQGTSSGCVDADPEVMAQMIQHPRSFYVNIHTRDHEHGAVRGQLRR